jgi:hypothetical protein
MWGLVLSCFAAVSSYKGAIAIRIFLGIFESTVVPGSILLTSQVCPQHPALQNQILIFYSGIQRKSKVSEWGSYSVLPGGGKSLVEL